MTMDYNIEDNDMNIKGTKRLFFENHDKRKRKATSSDKDPDVYTLEDLNCKSCLYFRGRCMKHTLCGQLRCKFEAEKMEAYKREKSASGNPLADVVFEEYEGEFMITETDKKSANYLRIVFVLRALHKNGEISDEEYEKAKRYYKTMTGSDITILE